MLKRNILMTGVAAVVLFMASHAIAGDAKAVDPVTDIPPLNGTNHNLSDPNANEAGTAEKRFLPNDYPDNQGNVFAGLGRPGERDISNHVFAQEIDPVLNTLHTNNFLWQFGQFLDHDFGITVDKTPFEAINILVPEDDLFFPPGSYITIGRQAHDPATGTAPGNPRLSINVQTGWIDASQVYGYDDSGELPNDANALRTHVGGRLKVEPVTHLLPRVPSPLPSPPFPSTLFLCGNFHPRCNETPGLTMMHTIFVREHNRKVAEYAAQNPTLDDEELYQLGRRWVQSLMQAITVNEFIPELTGRNVSKYTGHKPEVDGRLGLEFEHALYRVGHTLLTRNLQRFGGPNGQNPLPPLDFGESLFQAVTLFQTSADLDTIVRGFKRQKHEKVDCIVIDGVRNNLIVDEPGPPGTQFDLPAINLARGRELGLPSYNDTREGFGLPRVDLWQQAFDSEAMGRLASIYADPDEVDLFAGGICERPAFEKGHTGPIITAIIHRQIEDVRDADRFWFENPGRLPPKELAAVRQRRLADVIVDNTEVGREEMGVNAFRIPRSEEEEE